MSLARFQEQTSRSVPYKGYYSNLGNEKYEDVRVSHSNTYNHFWVDDNLPNGPTRFSQEQTSRSTPRWGENFGSNLNRLDEYNPADLRHYLVSQLDIDVYTPYCTPGIHTVPKMLIDNDYLVIPEYLWDRSKEKKGIAKR